MKDVMYSEFEIEKSRFHRGLGEIKQFIVKVFDMDSEGVEKQMKPWFVGSFIYFNQS